MHKYRYIDTHTIRCACVCVCAICAVVYGRVYHPNTLQLCMDSEIVDLSKLRMNLHFDLYAMIKKHLINRK